MALTVTIDAPNVNFVGNKKNVPVSIVPDSSYAIGGEAITAAQCGLVVLERIIWEGPAVDPDTADNAVVPYFDKANGLVQFFWSPTDTAAAGPLVEVPNNTSLAAYTVRGIAVGY